MKTNDQKEFEAISEKLRNVKVIAKSNGNNDDFTVEFEIASILDSYKREEYRQVDEEINAVEEASLAEIEKLTDRIAVLNKEIDTLTNHADNTDYIVAVASGFLCGLLDSFFVGEFPLEEANKWGTDKIENFVQWVAKNTRKEGKGKIEDIYDAISHLEKDYNIPSDNLAKNFGGGIQHHLKDFAHHPNIVGLIFSILTQFTGKAYGIGQNGVFMSVEVSSTDLIGKDFPTKISLGIVTWFFHLVNDVAGSTSSMHRNSLGTGLPGPIVSMLYEISKISFFNQSGNTDFSQWVTKLWNGTLPGLKERGIRFDMRTEIGMYHELGIPIIINECIVRAFYFIRRFAIILKENPVHSLSEFRNLNWKTILPFKNRTIARMITIASGTFTIVDLADAAIRSAMKNGLPTNPAFWASFVLRVNFVGIGRFTIALYNDVSMGIKRAKLVKERRDAFIYRELEKDVVIQCELGKTLIALAKMYEFIQDVVENTFETMAQVVEEEEESFDAVALASQRRKEMINRVKIQKI